MKSKFSSGGKIDLAHHGSEAVKSLHDVVAMDLAVEKADSITSAQDTLIVVTADHSHTFVISGYPRRGNGIFGKQIELLDPDNERIIAQGTQTPDVIYILYIITSSRTTARFFVEASHINVFFRLKLGNEIFLLSSSSSSRSKNILAKEKFNQNSHGTLAINQNISSFSIYCFTYAENGEGGGWKCTL